MVYWREFSLDHKGAQKEGPWKINLNIVPSSVFDLQNEFHGHDLNILKELNAKSFMGVFGVIDPFLTQNFHLFRGKISPH